MFRFLIKLHLTGNIIWNFEQLSTYILRKCKVEIEVYRNVGSPGTQVLFQCLK
jgi:hypothetical protein